MRQLITCSLAALLGLCVTANAATNPPNKNNQLPTLQDKISYALGVETGRAFKNHDVEVKPDIFAKGLQDGLTGKPKLLTEAQIKQTLNNFQQQTAEKFQKKIQLKAKENKKVSQAFLDTNKKQTDVVTLPSGLQYKIISKGTGPQPTLQDTVVVNYEGRLLNGKIFDSSYKRKEPATFPVSSVIKGWQEAIPLMHTGATWEIYIPPKLAYGERGVPGVIGPNQVLIFKVHLIKIKK